MSRQAVVQFIAQASGKRFSPGCDERSVFVRIDSKGRISIPAWLRRNFCLVDNAEIELRFDLRRNEILVVFDGQDGVEASMEGCGPSGRGSNGGGLPYEPDSKPGRRTGYPLPGPPKKEVEYGK